jgi:hypothetical protein
MFLPNQTNPFRITYPSAHHLFINNGRDYHKTVTDVNDGSPPLIRTGLGGDYTRDHTGDGSYEGLNGWDISLILLLFAVVLAFCI